MKNFLIGVLLSFFHLLVTYNSQTNLKKCSNFTQKQTKKITKNTRRTLAFFSDNKLLSENCFNCKFVVCTGTAQKVETKIQIEDMELKKQPEIISLADCPSLHSYTGLSNHASYLHTMFFLSILLSFLLQTYTRALCRTALILLPATSG